MFRPRGALQLVAICASFSALAMPPQTAMAPKPVIDGVPTGEKPSSTTPPTTSHALEREDLEAFLDGIIPLQLERSDIAGATILVMKGGKDLLRKGYGFSDVSKKKPVDPETTMFRLASISKVFTWISVMQLVEQRKLDIDADVNKYLDFQIAPAFGKPITLRNLMTHTGGFEEEIRDILLTDPKKATPLREFLMGNQPRRIFPPGEVPAYSNYGVGLAGYIVQRASGEPFEQYVAEHIFQALGMKHSSFYQPLAEDLSSFASNGYQNNTEKPAVGFEMFSPTQYGSVCLMAPDMGRRSESTKLSLGNLIGQGEATLDKDGVLKVDDFKDLRGHMRQWKPIGKDLWQEVDDQRRMFAIRNSSGKIVRIAVSFPGVQFERVPWYENSKMILPILTVSLVILAAVVGASLLRLGRMIFLSKRPPFKQQPGSVRLTLGAKLSATAWIILTIGTAVLMSRLENETMLPTHAIDKYFVMMNLVTGVAILLSIFAVSAGLRIWRLSNIRFISKLKVSLVAAACVFLTWFSVHWHLIGPAHRF